MPFNERRVRNQRDYHRKCVWHIARLETDGTFLLICEKCQVRCDKIPDDEVVWWVCPNCNFYYEA